MHPLSNRQYRYYCHLRKRGWTYFKRIMTNIKMYQDMFIFNDEKHGK